MESLKHYAIPYTIYYQSKVLLSESHDGDILWMKK